MKPMVSVAILTFVLFLGTSARADDSMKEGAPSALTSPVGGDPTTSTDSKVDCIDIPTLRNRTASLGASFSKIVDVGASASKLQKAEMTARFMLILALDSYLCRLEQALGPDNPISEYHQVWLNEVDTAFDDVSVALNDKPVGEKAAYLVKQRRESNARFIPNTDASKPYSVPKLNKNVNRAFYAVSPMIDYTTETKAEVYVKTAFKNIGADAKFLSTIADGSETVGNLLQTLELVRTYVGNYSIGNSTPLTVLSSTIRNVYAIGDQLLDKQRKADMTSKK